MEQVKNNNLEFGTIELREYLGIVLKRKWIFLACFIVPVILAVVYSFMQPSIFRSKAIIEVSSGFRMPLKEVYQESRRTFLNNQIALLEGNSIKRRIAKRLTSWKDRIPEKYLEPGLTITRVRGTTMLEIWIDSPYKEYTMAYLEVLTEEFLNLKKERKEKDSEFALVSLTKEIDRLNDKLAMSQSNLQNFREQNKDVMLEEYGNYSPRHMMKMATRLSELETDKALISKQIMALENSDDPSFWISVVNDIQKGVVMPALQKESQSRGQDNTSAQDESKNGQGFNNIEPLPFVFVLEKGQSRKWEALESRYRSLRSEQARIVDVYKPKHPDRVKLDKELVTVTREMKAEVVSLLETFKAKYKGIQLEESATNASMESWKTTNLASSSKINKLNMLKDEVDRMQRLYNVLIRRANEIETSTDFGLETVYIVESARLSPEPVGPKRMRNIVVAIMFGLGLGCGMVFFLDYIDDSIKSTDELKKYSGINAIGLVHHIEWNQSDIPSHKASISEDNEAVEAYRSIRTNLLLSSPDNSMKTLLITSALPSEGKTTVSVNTGIVLAQGGQKVLIIDGDMRRPTIHKMFGKKNINGLSTILSGEKSFEDCVNKTDVDGVDFLSAGTIVADAPKLFHNYKMKELLEYVSSKYDKVIIDSAPILTVTDSIILSDLVDSIMFVVHGARTSRMAVIKAKEILLANSSKLIGAIINNLPIEESGNYYYRYYGYRYKYRYKYGEREKKNSKKNKAKPDTIASKEKEECEEMII